MLLFLKKYGFLCLLAVLGSQGIVGKAAIFLCLSAVEGFSQTPTWIFLIVLLFLNYQPNSKPELSHFIFHVE